MLQWIAHAASQTSGAVWARCRAAQRGVRSSGARVSRSVWRNVKRFFRTSLLLWRTCVCGFKKEDSAWLPGTEGYWELPAAALAHAQQRAADKQLTWCCFGKNATPSNSIGKNGACPPIPGDAIFPSFCLTSKCLNFKTRPPVPHSVLAFWDRSSRHGTMTGALTRSEVVEAVEDPSAFFAALCESCVQ